MRKINHYHAKLLVTDNEILTKTVRTISEVAHPKCFRISFSDAFATIKLTAMIIGITTPKAPRNKPKNNESDKNHRII